MMSTGSNLHPNFVFGNALPPEAVASARRTFARYARKFGFDPGWIPKLEAGPVHFDAFGIRQLREIGKNINGNTVSGAKDLSVLAAPTLDDKRGIVIGTIRMGFGHYRIGLALASAARHMGVEPYWLDFLSFQDSAASKTIAYLEALYARFSRLSQNFKLFNRLVWEKITSDLPQRIGYCARDRELTRIFAPLLGDVPRNVPFLSTHPWTGQAAIHAGMQNVVTVVPDNYPLAFHLVEGSVHAVQTPSAYLGYRGLRNMGEKGQGPLNPMPEDVIRYTGHFVDHEIVSNIDADCEARLRRIRDKKTKRLLLTIGGAGAQVQRFSEIVSFCRDGVEKRQVALFINMGDHEGRWKELESNLTSWGIPFTLHDDWSSTVRFADDAGSDEVNGVHVFLNRDPFGAVYTTNLLMRHCDLMITKPSELSFYPVPKLFIQRVGRHEAWGAIRGAEIGDGTLETQSASSIFQTLRLIISDGDLLSLYCENIVKNHRSGIYDGAYKAVKIAMDRT